MKQETQNMMYVALAVLAIWLVFTKTPKKEKCCGMPA